MHGVPKIQFKVSHTTKPEKCQFTTRIISTVELSWYSHKGTLLEFISDQFIPADEQSL